MAEAAVVLVVTKIASVLAEEALKQGFSLLGQEASQLREVPDKLKAIQQELEVMRGFLRDADQWDYLEGGTTSSSSSSSADRSAALKAWVNNVRDAASDAEDVIDEVSYLLGTRRRPGFRAFLSNTMHLPPWLRVSQELQSIESRLVQLSQRKDRYGIDVTHHKPPPQSSSGDADKIWKVVAESSRLLQEDDVVGMDNSKATLISWLVDGNHDQPQQQKLSSVWGMGGLGKTTLVSQVYKSPQVRSHFSYRAWVFVSQTYQGDDLLRSIFQQLLTSLQGGSVTDFPQIDTMSGFALAENLQSFLQGKRYLVVLDDVWDVNAWQRISLALIDNKCGSRVVFTTRLREVAQIATEKYCMQLQPLPEEDAWALFCKKAFRYPCTYCPPELENCARRILDRCQGLALAIVAVGSMLSLRDQSRPEWERVYKGLSWEFNHNPHLHGVRGILTLSFKELPYYLRNCLLYCSMFPEDTPMKRTKLIQLWIAEGFIEQRGQRTMEEVVEDNLNELVHRCMLQVVKRNDSDQIKECQLHDIVRDLLLSISHEERFCMIYGKTAGTRIDHHETGQGHVRRLSIHGEPRDDQNTLQMSRLRSLLLLQCGNTANAQVIATSLLSSARSWRLLRVLDLEGVPINSLPDQVFNLINLRYLCLRGTKVGSIPNAIKWLVNLETLDLRDTEIRQLPRGITKLKKLVHLLVRQKTFSHDVRLLYYSGIWKLRDLHTLDGVEADDKLVYHLDKMTQLVNLRILQVKHVHCGSLCAALSKMGQLTKLKVFTSDDIDTVGLDLEVGGLPDSPPLLLQRLYLIGRLKGGALPTWVASLHNLRKLTLCNCRLITKGDDDGDEEEEEDPLASLHALPHLTALGLLADACMGRRLRFRHGGFPSLKCLALYNMTRIQQVDIEQGAMPSLRELVLSDCPEMKQIPQGIQHLIALQELNLMRMPEDFLKSLLEEEALNKVHHIPEIWHAFRGSDGNWDVVDPRETASATLTDFFPELPVD